MSRTRYESRKAVAPAWWVLALLWFAFALFVGAIPATHKHFEYQNEAAGLMPWLWLIPAIVCLVAFMLVAAVLGDAVLRAKPGSASVADRARAAQQRAAAKRGQSADDRALREMQQTEAAQARESWAEIDSMQSRVTQLIADGRMHETSILQQNIAAMKEQAPPRPHQTASAPLKLMLAVVLLVVLAAPIYGVMRQGLTGLAMDNPFMFLLPALATSPFRGALGIATVASLLGALPLLVAWLIGPGRFTPVRLVLLGLAVVLVVLVAVVASIAWGSVVRFE